MLYKLVPKTDWYRRAHIFTGNFNEHLFMHLSTRSGLKDVLVKRYTQTQEDLYLICIDRSTLNKDNLIMKSNNFFHYYDYINKNDSVVWVRDVI